MVGEGRIHHRDEACTPGAYLGCISALHGGATRATGVQELGGDVSDTFGGRTLLAKPHTGAHGDTAVLRDSNAGGRLLGEATVWTSRRSACCRNLHDGAVDSGTLGGRYDRHSTGGDVLLGTVCVHVVALRSELEDGSAARSCQRTFAMREVFDDCVSASLRGRRSGSVLFGRKPKLAGIAANIC